YARVLGEDRYGATAAASLTPVGGLLYAGSLHPVVNAAGDGSHDRQREYGPRRSHLHPAFQTSRRGHDGMRPTITAWSSDVATPAGLQRDRCPNPSRIGAAAVPPRRSMRVPSISERLLRDRMLRRR